MTDRADSTAPLRPGSRVLVGALLLVGLALAAWHAWRVQFFCDDAYISFRYARNLVEGHGLVFNPGERVEGYTNFLWVLLLAAGMAVGIGAETWSLVMGGACLAATLGATLLLGRRLLGSALAGALALVVVAGLGPVVLWSVAGLESSLFAALFLLALLRQVTATRPRHLVVAGVLYALCTMTRPDGAVFGLVAGTTLVVGDLFRHADLGAVLRRGGALLGGFAALFVPFMAWRIAYYDAWLPNTFYVKSGAVIQWTLGRQYLREFAREYPTLFLLTVAGAGMALGSAARRAQRAGLVLLLACLAGFLVYVAWAGGDYMALYRFLVPVLPLAAILAVLPVVELLLEPVARRGPALRAGATTLALVATGALAWTTVQPSLASARGEESFLHPLANMARNTSRWLLTGEALQRALWPGATIATTAAGAIPWASELPTIDQSGLCDHTVARVEHDPWMLERPGHMKQATRRYLMERRPDLILGHPQFRSARRTSFLAPQGYLTRALKIDGYQDEQGEDQWLVFFLDQRRRADGDAAGMVDPATWPATE